MQSLNDPRVNGNKRQQRIGEDHRPNAVVLGTGFGGLWTARTLAKGQVNILLIDRHNYHTFFPLLYQVGAAELEPVDIAQPLPKIFWKRPNVRFYPGAVQEVDLSAKMVRLPGDEVPYDYLVVALGSQPNFYGIPGAAEYAFTRLIVPSDVSSGKGSLALEAVHEESQTISGRNT
jgi:NADH:ubiquinone reductase (H+-translocating)